MIGFTQAIKRFFLKAFDFSSRASRAEYWWVALFQMLLIVVPAVLMAVIIPGLYESVDEGAPGLAIEPLFAFILIGVGVLAIAMVVPHVALFVRRLHDIGKSGWIAVILLFQLIPVIGIVFTVAAWVFALIPGDPDDNLYGPPPGSGWD